MVNLEWYRTFKAVYQNGTLTKAADELMISQPNVSVQLSSLEAYIGHPLFIRHPRKMEPTEYGKRLYTQIVEALDNLEKVEAEFKKSILNKAPTIRFGTPPEIFRTYMAANIRHLNCNINVRFGLASQLINALRNNDLDIAIITKPEKSDDELIYEPVLTETFRIVCSRQFDIREFTALLYDNPANAEKWLKKQTWYAYDDNLPIIRRFWKDNFKKRPILKVKATIPDNNTLIEAVANSNALTVSSDLIAGKALKQGIIKTLWDGTTPSTNTLYLSYKKTKVSDELIEEIKNFIKTSFNL